MKSFNTKLVLSALGIVAMLTTPVFAQRPQRVSHVNQSAASQTIPGYDKDGRTVEIPDPDQR